MPPRCARQPSLLAPCQIERPPSGQEPAAHLSLDLQRWVSTHKLAARARHRDAFACNLFSQRVSAVQIRKRGFQQNLALRTVSAVPHKLTPKRLRTLRKMPGRLGERARSASFHVSIALFGFTSRCEWRAL